MNIRKAVDYSTMFAELESAMEADLPQMELYCEIGKAVCARMEKGAAVAAAEFLKEQYPDMTGFLTRTLSMTSYTTLIEACSMPAMPIPANSGRAEYVSA